MNKLTRALTTVAVLNDYSIPSALALATNESYPAHHTWGVSLFSEFGIKIGPTPYPDKYFQHAKSEKIRAMLRSFFSQFWLFIFQRSFDVVYSACQSETWLLARLRRYGLFRRPIVMLVHHPLKGKLRGGNSFVSGHDCILFLSQKVLIASKENFPEIAKQMYLLPWGVDLSFYDRTIPPSARFGSNFFVSAGKANRDHSTLAEASIGLDRKVVIICSNASKPRRIPSLNVEVVHDASGHALSYMELLQVYRSALAIVIPLDHVNALAGLTSLLDAMACGKPVIMTKNPYVDIDIEKHGFGIWVEPGDAHSLHAAMMSLSEDSPLCREMGSRAREYAVQEFSYSQFSENLSKHIKSVATWPALPQ